MSESPGVRRFAGGPPPLALYVHIPWCVRKCPYCDFNSHATPDALPQMQYVDALLRDLSSQLTDALAQRPLVSIFIGGGTPSLFSGEALGRLLAGVRQCCATAPDIEITLEANPGTVDARHFDGYARAGVDRLSIGVQSLSGEYLTRLGRIHDPAQARAALQSARAAGFGNVNLDLMFGLPGQDLAQARDDLAALIALAPEHISYYQLTLEPNTAFSARPPPGLPDDDLGADMQIQGIEMLAAAGYGRYEISAYARDGRRCRHNLNYWRFGDYLGIGAGAHGKLTDAASGIVQRTSCPRHPAAYLQAQAPVAAARRLTDADLIAEFALYALRLINGVEADLFERHTGIDGARIATIVADARARGLLEQDEHCIRPTALGVSFLNDLLMLFDEKAEP